MRDHTVAEGECLHQIAKESGFYWETLWNHPSNAELKKTQKDPESLQPGVVVHIPDLKEKTERCATNKVHLFQKKGPAICYGFDVKADAESPAIFDSECEIEGPDIFDCRTDIEPPATGETSH